MRSPALLLGSVFCTLLLAACGSSSSGTGGSSSTHSSSATGAGGSGGDDKPSGTTALFDLSADLKSTDHFYDFPYPSDLRLTAQGTPELTGLPIPSLAADTFGPIRDEAMQHPGFLTVPVGYFRFTGALPDLDVSKVIAADKASPILLIDVDPTSSEVGKLFPTVATVPGIDDWITDVTLAVAPRPGFVLHGKRKYAFVVMKSLKDAAGKDLVAPAALTELAGGKTPSGSQAAAAKTLYAPLWDALDKAGVSKADVVAATVFTTGDVVADNETLADAVSAKYQVTIDNLALNTANAAIQDRYCELTGKVTFPQFQQGTPPFDTQGLFQIGSDGLPVKQRDEDAPIAITIPKGEMPADGFPLVLYFHGSGGLSTAIVDRGTWHVETDPTKCPEGTLETWANTTGCNTAGQGPAYVLAPHGFAMADSALPVNPERLPGASETAYLNLNNLPSGRDVFRQGILEQRMYLDALLKLEIDPALLASCTGVSLPAGATKYKLNPKAVYGQGQSMGGMYTNLIGATEKRIRAAVPTGAGGYWSHFILITPLFTNSAALVGTALLHTTQDVTFLHPGLSVFETAWEAVDPMVAMPRLARRPLSGHPVRSIYEPCGEGDSYFPEATYDAMATAYGHKETGDVVWSTMQDALSLEGLGGVIPYPVKSDLTSEDGTAYTGMVVQYKGDGIYDPHALYSQLDAVKYQYGCFLETFNKTGTGVVPAPAALGTTCPTQ